MKNITELRNDLIIIYEKLRSGEIGISEAKEMANVAGKVISSTKVQIEYNKMTGNNSSKIKFLENAE
jgi:hypothetical protein